ncbi:hypothetical protein ACIBF5_09680 [Micromonospora sp. NPDC050417]|uniref:hypothetical protein n=1 Tax=Micromonospora sp. NPDC050417 TaxID=3364280 RepID=UPI0037B6EFB2
MTGPETGGPPSGPGRTSTPMSVADRAWNYATQTGRRIDSPTPRQQRRIRHKANRAGLAGLVTARYTPPDGQPQPRPRPTTPVPPPSN